MTKQPAKKPAAEKTAAKPAAKAAAKPKSGGAFNAPLKPSAELAAVIGADPLPRTEAVSKIWDYIKKNNLQNAANKREILADKKLEAVFGKPKATMFEMSKFLAQHLKAV